MPHLDVIDELNRVRDVLLKQITSHAGKRGSSLLTDLVSREFAELVSHVDEERREWESVLNFLMERENEEDDKHERPA